MAGFNFIDHTLAQQSTEQPTEDPKPKHWGKKAKQPPNVKWYHESGKNKGRGNRGGRGGRGQHRGGSQSVAHERRRDKSPELPSKAAKVADEEELFNCPSVIDDEDVAYAARVGLGSSRNPIVGKSAPKVEDVITSTNQKLSATRRKRKPEPGNVKPDAIASYTQISHVPSLHATKPAGITALDLAADGNVIVTSGADKAVQMFDVAASKVLGTLKGHTKLVKHVVSEKAGEQRVVISGGDDKTVRIGGEDDGKRKAKGGITGRKGEITGLGLHPSGQYFAAGSTDSTWSLYDIAEAKSVATYSALPGVDGSFAYTSFSDHSAPSPSTSTLPNAEASSSTNGHTQSRKPAMVDLTDSPPASPLRERSASPPRPIIRTRDDAALLNPVEISPLSPAERRQVRSWVKSYRVPDYFRLRGIEINRKAGWSFFRERAIVDAAELDAMGTPTLKVRSVHVPGSLAEKNAKTTLDLHVTKIAYGSWQLPSGVGAEGIDEAEELHEVAEPEAEPEQQLEWEEQGEGAAASGSNAEASTSAKRKRSASPPIRSVKAAIPSLSTSTDLSTLSLDQLEDALALLIRKIEMWESVSGQSSEGTVARRIEKAEEEMMKVQGEIRRRAKGKGRATDE